MLLFLLRLPQVVDVVVFEPDVLAKSVQDRLEAVVARQGSAL